MANNKRLVIILSLVAAVCLSVVGFTVAYYRGQTLDEQNQFRVGNVDVSVPEYWEDPKGDQSVKRVTLQNTGSVDAYLRATIVPVFRDSEGTMACNVDYSHIRDAGTAAESGGYILVTAPDGERIYKLHLLPGWEANWHFSASDGNVFYYREIVPPDKLTTELLVSVIKEDADNWVNLNVEILADAVQTEGDAVLEHLKSNWGVTSIDANGKLHWD